MHRIAGDEDMGGRGHAPPALSREGAAARADVLLLHGFFGVPWTMRLLARSLRAQGLAPWCPWYDSWSLPFDVIVDRITRQLIARALGRERPVHVVGHSMGGLIARGVMEHIPAAHRGRMVMIGTPNAGSELADFCTRWAMLRPILGRAGPALVTRRALAALDGLPLPPPYPVGIVAGNRPLANALRILPAPHDGKVSVASTHLPGEADHIVLPVSHAIMPFDRAVQRQTGYFLDSGAFRHPD